MSAMSNAAASETKAPGAGRNRDGRVACLVRSVSPRKSDRDYFDLALNEKTVARRLSNKQLVQCLAREHDTTPAEMVVRYTPGGYRGPADGTVLIDHRYDPQTDEGRLELLIWSIVERDASAMITAHA